MDIRIIKEAGYEAAIGGMAFSFQTESPELQGPNRRSYTVANSLAHQDGGHNKFLEHIIIWVDIRASLTWWKQADTYRVGISKLSKSTMHTVMKRRLTSWDFNDVIDKHVIHMLNAYIMDSDFKRVIDYLPGAYMQTRRCCLNYKTLRNMINQRRGHKLPEWKEFIDGMLEQVENKQLLIKE